MRTSRSKCSQDGESVIRAAVDDVGAYDGEQDDEDMWYLGDPIRENRSGVPRTSGVSVSLEARRRRVKLIECQYRKPTQVHVVTEGPWRGRSFQISTGRSTSLPFRA